MKKALMTIALLAAGLTASAQGEVKEDTIHRPQLETVDMNRTFSVGGNALMCLRSNNATKRSVQPLEWTLKNDIVGGQNFVTLDVKNRNTGASVAHQTWDEGQLIRMKIKEGKPAMSEVYDDMFSHLRIVDVNMGWIILFFSEILK